MQFCRKLNRRATIIRQVRVGIQEIMKRNEGRGEEVQETEKLNGEF